MSVSLEFDLHRSQLLAQYLPAWGLPTQRKTFLLNDQGADLRLECYVFAGEDADQVSRFVSIGLSRARHISQELLLVLPADFAEKERDSAFDYLYHQAQLTLLQQRQFETCYPAFRMSERDATACWPSHVLFDRAFSEVDAVQKVYVGYQAVELAWLVPIFATEAQFIDSDGLDAFDQQLKLAGVNLLDPLRKSCL